MPHAAKLMSLTIAFTDSREKIMMTAGMTAESKCLYSDILLNSRLRGMTKMESYDS